VGKDSVSTANPLKQFYWPWL